jgi:hypothetical protein
MKFEWDERKNRANIKNHGIDFADAWEVFENHLFVWMDNREDYGEDRWVGLGLMHNLVVVLVVFVEKEEETIRIISLRKAKGHEREKYEKAIKNGLGTRIGHERRGN